MNRLMIKRLVEELNANRLMIRGLCVSKGVEAVRRQAPPPECLGGKQPRPSATARMSRWKTTETFRRFTGGTAAGAAGGQPRPSEKRECLRFQKLLGI